MSVCPPPFNRALAALWGGGFGVDVVIIALMTTAAGPRVLASGEETPGAGPNVSPNQSVALDDPTVPPDGDRPAPSEATTPLSRDADAEAPRPSPSMPTRRIERREASAGATSPLADRGTPWYRTGLGALAIVLALVGGVYWLVRRWMPAARLADGGVMRVVARTPLGPKHHAALVQLGRRFVIVGLSPDGARTLSEITDPDEVADLIGRTAARGGPAPIAFDAQLTRELGEYRDELEDKSDEVRITRPTTRPGGAPLTDLLQKLRALRTK